MLDASAGQAYLGWVSKLYTLEDVPVFAADKVSLGMLSSDKVSMGDYSGKALLIYNSAAL